MADNEPRVVYLLYEPFGSYNLNRARKKWGGVYRLLKIILEEKILNSQELPIPLRLCIRRGSPCHDDVRPRARPALERSEPEPEELSHHGRGRGQAQHGRNRPGGVEIG